MASQLKTASEVVCATRMWHIEQGGHPVAEAPHVIEDIAERYCVRADTVYKGVRARDPMYPEAHRNGAGPRAWLFFCQGCELLLLQTFSQIV